MADETDTPPPRLNEPSERPPLRRSRADRVIAGVCGGIGRRFDIDPVIVRIGWVALTLLGGSGVWLYLIAWVVMAKEGEAESAAVRTLRGRDTGKARRIIAILALVVLVMLFRSPFGWLMGPFGWLDGWGTGNGLFLPLLLVAAGVTLLVWPDRERREPVPSPSVDAPAPPPLPSSPWYPPPASALYRPAGKRQRGFLGPLTLAMLLVITGVTVALDRADIVSVDPAVFLAISLTLIGLVLTLSAFIGRARGLILLGVLLFPVVWWFHTIDLTWWGGIGEQRHTVTSIAQLEPEYRLGIGQLVIDLTGLDLAGTTRELAVGTTIGEVVVVVPERMHVELTADGRIGEVRIDRPGPDLTDDGIDASLQTELGSPSGGTLVLDLDVGVGSARVEVR